MSDVPPVEESLGLLEPEMARCVGKKAVHPADQETFSSFFSSCLMSMCNRVGYDKSDQEIVWMVGLRNTDNRYGFVQGRNLGGAWVQ